MNVTYDIKIGEWGILGYGLDHNYYMVKVMSIIWGYAIIEKIRQSKRGVEIGMKKKATRVEEKSNDKRE